MDFSGLEKLSLVDFDDKITCTLFTAGCNFRCPFCHNGELVLHPELSPKLNWDEVYSYLEKRRKMLDAVTISGGEPLIHPDVEEKIAAIKKLGYMIKLDTNGSFPAFIKHLVESGLVDYVAMDIKNSRARYAETIGLKSFDLTPIQESLDYLLGEHVDYELRTTVMEEFHDEESFKDIAAWVKGAKRYFIQGYKDREGCIEHGFHMVEKEKALRFRAILEEAGIKASLRGYD